jgi:sulfate adenylyltransferase
MLLRRTLLNARVARSHAVRYMASTQPPHGGEIKDSILTNDAEKESLAASCTATFELNDRQLCDTELIMNGAFSPLEGFMNEDTYDGVVSNMRLPESNLLFGLPVVLDTDRDDIQPGSKVLLQAKGTDIAVLDVESRWTPRKDVECKECYRTSSLEHPGVQMVAMERKHDYVGGKVTGLNVPERDFLCVTPNELRATLPAGKDVVAFQCRNPIHRAHYELFMRALEAENVESDGIVLVHPTCGPTQSDDIPGDVRYKTYVVLKEETKEPRVHWAYLPYSMHMAGPREAIQHMMLRKNYGCTHFIIGRDMAGSKSSIDGEDFYGAYDAQECAQENSEELGVKCVPSLNLAYTAEEGYVTADIVEEKGLTPLKLSGTEFRRMLRAGEDIPEWFAFKSVVDVLRANS